ncbi:MAG TPA: prepilin-type N-terminal cleavage/methylation domain-containing protein, partial [Acidimicrobiia bacterium]|nr:prepilin-type N-terminal cleavage/methylation domain-containing protein [Acidimicrobiia bacterium]
MERPAVMRMLRRRTVRRPEQGMTLVEVIVGVVILTMITGAASAALITGLKNSRPTTQRVRESNDAQVIAAFLIRDAQAAGGINPFTATTDPSLGVSTTDAAGCSTGDTLVMRFKWRDFTSSSAYHDHVATYYLNPLSHQLTRRTCVDGTNDSSTPLGGSISSVSGACVTNSVPSACGPALPDIVQLNVTEIKLDNEPAPYSYTLQANVRPESQIAPNGSTGSVVPVMALGGSVCTDGTAGVDVSDSATTVHIYGGVIVNATNGTGCPAFNYGAHPTYTSGVVDIVSGGSCPGCPFPTSSFNSPLGDPFASLAVPGTCPNPLTGSNPGTTTVGGVVHYHPGTYPQVVNISNGTVVFDTGIYIFCLGVNISGGTVSSGAGGVLWYFANSGTLTTSGNTVLNLSPTTAGNYAGLLIWQDKL